MSADSPASFWQAAAELERAGIPFVVATLLSSRGSAPQETGAKAIVTCQGLHFGTVGGGKVEARAIAMSQELLGPSTDRGPVMRTWNLQRDIGMTCGGEVTFLFEVHDAKKWPIAVFGAGHVAQAVVRVLATLECHVTCVDHRPEWLDRLPESPRLARIRLSTAVEARTVVETLDPRTFFVVMTQGHATDVPILEEIFRRRPDVPFVGVMGSDVKAMKIRNELVALGVPAALVERLRCPIGLSLGNNEPAEIAISVAAQLLRDRDMAFTRSDEARADLETNGP